MPWSEARLKPASAAFYIVPFFGYLLQVVVIAMLAATTGTDTVGEGLVLGLLMGAVFTGAVFFVLARFDPTKPEPMNWYWISAGSSAIGMILTSVSRAASAPFPGRLAWQHKGVMQLR
jgi:Na+/H+ antiporter NhaA